MSKLDGVKAKIQDLKGKITAAVRNILLKIPFLKKFAPTEASKAELVKKANAVGLGEVYREGNSGTRLLVIFVVFFFALFLFFGGQFVRGLLQGYGKSKYHRQMEKEYSEVVRKEVERVATAAAVISVGHIASDTVKPDGSRAFLNVDVWAVCDSPETAKVLEDTAIRTHSAIIDVIRALSEQKISPVTDEGRERLRQDIIKAINANLTHGKVTDIHFYNLIIE